MALRQLVGAGQEARTEQVHQRINRVRLVLEEARRVGAIFHSAAAEAVVVAIVRPALTCMDSGIRPIKPEVLEERGAGCA